MQGEFRMITDLAEVTPKELKFNYDELKAFLSENLKQYRTAVVTEDGISDAKADRAKLNKLADNINSYRINVKMQLMAQYDDDFKPKCDELVSMTKEASDNIGNQIKAFEKAEADAKIARIRAHYDALDGYDEERGYFPWDKLLNPKWSNKGYSEDDARGEIAAALLKTREDIQTIRTLDEQDVPYLLDFYKSCRDIGAVIRKASELKQRREAEARRAAEARARQEAENARRAKETIAAARRVESEAVKPAAAAPAQADKPDNRRRVVMCVWGTDADLMLLSNFMKEHNIEFGPVE